MTRELGATLVYTPILPSCKEQWNVWDSSRESAYASSTKEREHGRPVPSIAAVAGHPDLRDNGLTHLRHPMDYIVTQNGPNAPPSVSGAPFFSGVHERAELFVLG